MSAMVRKRTRSPSTPSECSGLGVSATPRKFPSGERCIFENVAVQRARRNSADQGNTAVGNVCFGWKADIGLLENGYRDGSHHRHGLGHDKEPKPAWVV